MGSCVIANVKQGGPGTRSAGKRAVEADVTLSASYATGGETVALTSLGLKRVDGIVIPSHDFNSRKAVATTSSRVGLSVELGGTVTAPKLLAFDSQATEVANATNLSARGPIRIRFLGC